MVFPRSKIKPGLVLTDEKDGPASASPEVAPKPSRIFTSSQVSETEH